MPIRVVAWDMSRHSVLPRGPVRGLAAASVVVIAAVAALLVSAPSTASASAQPTPSVHGSDLAELVVSPDYWKSLCPALHVSGPEAYSQEFLNYAIHVRHAEIADWLRTVELDGYFVSPNPAVEALGDVDESAWRLPARWEDMARCIAAVRDEGWPAVFVFVFDEFWLTMSRLRHVLRELLGPDTMFMQVLWAYRVHAVRAQHGSNAEAAGWFAHRDRPWLGTGGVRSGNPPYDTAWPPSLNIWFPLTMATPDNGCMYIYPKSGDASVRPAADATGTRLHHDHEQGLPGSTANVRALPAAPGQFMGWDGEVHHWGGRSSPITLASERISFNFEAVRNLTIGAQVTRSDVAFWPLDLFPKLGFRLRAIDSTVSASVVHRYMHPVLTTLWCASNRCANLTT